MAKKKTKKPKGTLNMDTVSKFVMKKSLEDGSWLLIERVNNGFVLSGYGEMFNGFSRDVIRENGNEMDPNDEETRLGYDLLWYIINHFGLRGSKYDKLRLTVEIEGLEEGDK